MIVRTSAGGDSVRLTLSNALGVGEVRHRRRARGARERGSAIVAETDRAVTFGGRASFSVQPGTLVVSDPVALTVPPLTELAVSLYLPNETRGVTTHEFALNTTYVVAGNAAGAASMANARTNLTYFWLAGVDVLASADAGAIVTLGDSITDGVLTTPDSHRAWPSLLAAKLQGDPATSHWAVINAGSRATGCGATSSARARSPGSIAMCSRVPACGGSCCSKASTTSRSRPCPPYPTRSARRPMSSSKPSNRSSTVRMRAASRSWAAR